MILLGLPGVVALGAGVVLGLRRRQDVVVRGDVVAVRSAREGGPVLVQYLTVAFRDEDGEDVRADVRTRSALAPGTAVTLRYPPGDAAHPRIELFRADLVLAAGGVLAVVVGLLPMPAGLLLAMGPVFAGVGAWTLRPLLGGVKVRGTVVRVDRKRDADGDDLWRPVVRFHDREERERVVEYEVWTSGRGPQVGASQLLWYRPEDPARIVLRSGMVFGGAFAVAGLAMVVGGLLVLLLR